MNITKFVVSTLLAATVLFSARAADQHNKSKAPVDGRDLFATKREISFGGIGMINKHLYVVVADNERNTLIVTPTEETEERWYGKSVTEPEVAIFYEGKILSPQGLPDGFDLSKSVLVSFERDKVRFFDFQAMAGGYYETFRTDK